MRTSQIRKEFGRELRIALFMKKLVNATANRPRRRLEYDIRTDLKEISVNTRERIDSAQIRDYWRAFENAAFNLRVP